MGVTGDFKGLEDLRRKMAAIADGHLRRNVNKVCAEAAVKLLDDEFRSSTDPYGNPWAPLSSRSGKPLMDTGTHLRNGLAAQATDSGFTVSTAFKGAAVHQYGAVIVPKNAKALAFKVRGAPMKSSRRGKASMVFAKKITIPRRQYMPEGELGPKWEKGLGAAADDAMRDLMGGR